MGGDGFHGRLVAFNGVPRDPRADAGTAYRRVQNAHGHIQLRQQLFGEEIGAGAHAVYARLVAGVPIAVLGVGLGQLVRAEISVLHRMRHLQHPQVTAAGLPGFHHGDALRRGVEAVLHVALPEGEPQLAEHHVGQRCDGVPVGGKRDGIGVVAPRGSGEGE